MKKTKKKYKNILRHKKKNIKKIKSTQKKIKTKKIKKDKKILKSRKSVKKNYISRVVEFQKFLKPQINFKINLKASINII